MTMMTILLADNNTEFLDTRAEMLEKAGYRVLKADTPLNARKILEDNRIDLAILDLRLENDKDENDHSGLDIAKEVAPTIPKIILTWFPTTETAIEALSMSIEGLPPAIRFLSKSKTRDELVQAVREGLVLAERLRQSLDVAAKQITNDYQEARKQARINYWASLCVATLGMVVILVGIVLALRQALAIAIASAIVGLLAEGIGYLFFRRLDVANERMDRYHTELLQVRRFEILLAACSELPIKRENASKERVIQKATDYWLDAPISQSQTPLSETTEKAGS